MMVYLAHIWRGLAVVGLALGLSGAVLAAEPTAPDPAHPQHTHAWQETRLYFAIARLDASTRAVTAAEQHWQQFLDQQLTPRFPAGLSVQDVYGQWQGPAQIRPVRLRSKLVIIDHPDTATDRARIEAIRQQWKHETGDLSVLRVTVPADVSF